MKKALLTTLLVSSALLGSSVTSAATKSPLKAEKKIVTVTSKKAKLYKNEKLQSPKKIAQGKVYKVDGYRMIKKKHYYRVYQENSKGKKVFQGYLYTKETKELKPKKENQLVMGKLGSDVWKNLYLTKKGSFLRADTLYKVKSSYQLGNGKKYYTIYVEKENKKDQFVGYINTKDTKRLKKIKPTTSYVEVKKKTIAYSNLFLSKKNKVYSQGTTFQIKDIYQLSNRDCVSIYKNNKFLGYLDTKYLNFLYPNKVEQKEQKQSVKEDTFAFSDLCFTKKIAIKKGTILKLKSSYRLSGNKIFYLAYDYNSGKKIGYVAKNAVSRVLGYTKKDFINLDNVVSNWQDMLDAVSMTHVPLKNEMELRKLYYRGQDLLRKMENKEELPHDTIVETTNQLKDYKLIIDDQSLREELNYFWKNINNYYITQEFMDEYQQVLNLPDRTLYFPTDERMYETINDKIREANRSLEYVATKYQYEEFKKYYLEIQNKYPNSDILDSYSETYNALSQRWESNQLSNKKISNTDLDYYIERLKLFLANPPIQ